MSEAKLDREPKRALSPEYHKAHKQVMLWAGILLVWELVGVDLEKAKDAEGIVGATVRSIKSPQAVPWVLAILVAYLVFKLNVEWYQCDAIRRNTRPARTDFFSAWIVSVMAYLLYAGQSISRAQLADKLVALGENRQQSYFLGFLTGVVTIFSISMAVINLKRTHKDPLAFVWFLMGPIGILFSVLSSRVYNFQILWKSYLRSVLVGILIASSTVAFRKRRYWLKWLSSRGKMLRGRLTI